MEAAEFHRDLAALAWQVELGADEALGEVPVDRYRLGAPQQEAASAPVAAPVVAAQTEAETVPDPVQAARAAAEAARDLDGLCAAIAAFDGLELKKGARNTVFSDGRPGARVMIVGEAPGADEDRQGKPFVGRAGQLLDKMFAAIGLSRADGGLYITNILPWRPPGNRTPEPAEIATMMPFVARHVALAAPDVLIPMGNVSCQGLIGRQGITRLRGRWTEGLGRPVLPMFHPAYLLRSPQAKREAWADLLELKAWLGAHG